MKRQDEEALAAERQRASEREAAAVSGKMAAQAEADRVTREAEAARIRAQADADRATRDAEAAKLKADAKTGRLTAEKNEQALSAAMEADRIKRANEVQAAAAAAQSERLRAESDAREAAAKAEADRLRLDNDAQRAAAQLELDKVAKQKAQLEAEKAELRIELLKQFNVILQTRDTARGLIVNMSDVLFDTAKFTLRPIAREKLARVAGIVAGHPGLRLDVEGHTDSVGGDEYNQTLRSIAGLLSATT